MTSVTDTTSFTPNPDDLNAAVTFPAASGRADQYGYDNTGAVTSIAANQAGQATASFASPRQRRTGQDGHVERRGRRARRRGRSAYLVPP